MRSLFFILWSLVVMAVGIVMMCFVGFVGYSTYKMGPSGIGHVVGQVVNGYNDTVHARR